jgi:hypothetical protein
LLRVCEETARTQVDIVLNDKASFEVVFGVRCSELDWVSYWFGLLLGLEQFVELPYALLGFKQGVWDNKAFQVIVFILRLRIRQRARGARL